MQNFLATERGLTDETSFWYSGVSFSSTAARTRQHARARQHVRQGGRRDHQTILTGNGRCSRTWGCPNPTTSANQRAKRRKDCSAETRISTDGATAAARSQSLLGLLYLSLCQPKLQPPPESEPISSSDSVLLLPSTERTERALGPVLPTVLVIT